MVALFTMTMVSTSSDAITAPRTKVWVFGDSVTRGAWLDDPTKGWVDLLTTYAATQNVDVYNYGNGGSNLHDPKGGSNLIINQVKTVFDINGYVPDAVIIAAGTNDVGGHQLGQPQSSPSNIDYTLYAAIDVQNYLKAKGVKRVYWNTVYPWAPHETPTSYGITTPGAWIPLLMGRVDYINGWMYAMWPDQVINSYSTLLDWPNTKQGKPEYFIDGFHPTAEGHRRIAQEYVTSIFVASPFK